MDSATQPESRALQVNAAIHEYLRDLLARVDWREDPTVALDLAEQMADFAASNHPGRFADGGLENVALEIGRQLDRFLERSPSSQARSFRLPPSDGRRSIIHVATATAGIGGWTRALLNWIRQDPDSRHSLVLTRQEFHDNVRPWLREVIEQNGGSLIMLPLDANLLVRAKWVRELAQNSADAVVLHQSWSDLVATLAFAVRDCPPITLVNQVDHLFWVGSSVVDGVINLRPVEDSFSESRRFISRNLYLPIPLSDSLARRGRDEARALLGIPTDRVMVLTMGREVKYLPAAGRSFVATARKILDQNTEAHLFVIGVTPAYAKQALGDPQHPRLHFLGIVEDPSAYEAAADVYLESFPFGSLTALLEAGLAGTFPVRAYAPLCRPLVSYDEALDDICPVPANEDEYIAHAGALIRDPAHRERLGSALQDQIRAVHCGAGWRSRLESLYAAMRDIAHAPKTLPRAEARSTPLDVALSIWHDSLKTVSVPWRSQGDANGTPPQEDTAAQPEAAALLALIWQLRDWSQRSSRQASVRSFELLAKQIDDEAARLGDQNRHGLRRELLASVVERMTWAKWERDWASFWELRRFVRSQWEGEAHLPPIATAWIAPRWAYQAKDALDRLFKQNSSSP